MDARRRNKQRFNHFFAFISIDRFNQSSVKYKQVLEYKKIIFHILLFHSERSSIIGTAYLFTGFCTNLHFNSPFQQTAAGRCAFEEAACILSLMRAASLPLFPEEKKRRKRRQRDGHKPRRRYSEAAHRALGLAHFESLHRAERMRA